MDETGIFQTCGVGNYDRGVVAGKKSIKKAGLPIKT